jgi:Raf kinase inhibitor-like YbhB/YbcL family protein
VKNLRKEILIVVVVVIVVVVIGMTMMFYRMPSQGPSQGVPQIFPEELASLLKNVPRTLGIESPAFKNGSYIPTKYTCDGIDISPELRISGIPFNAKSIVILMFDPDAPGGVFWHWIFYGIKPGQSLIPENIAKNDYTDYGINGVNSFGYVGYGGPCPPRGDKPHRYVFVVLALDTESSWGPRLSFREVIDKVKGHVIAYGYIIGLYSR